VKQTSRGSEGLCWLHN